MNKEHEGFSKQDLIDRRDSILSEWNDLRKEINKMLDEAEYLNQLIRQFDS